MEKTCVTESLLISCQLAAKDLEIQLKRGGCCKLVNNVLMHVFLKKKAFYKGGKSVYQHVSNSSGHPEVRLRNIEKFRASRGFTNLNRYLLERIEKPDDVDGDFPSLEFIENILLALLDTISQKEGEVTQQQEDDAILITSTVMRYLRLQSDDSLKKLPSDNLCSTIKALRKIYDRLTKSRRSEMLEFYSFWRDLVLAMITSPSLPLKLTGWEQVNEIIRAVAEHRPPPKAFSVSSAGCPFVNGTYVYAGLTTPDGYAVPGSEVSYVYTIPEGAPDGAGKKLTLFRCTMRSQQKWWFLSEADEDQPGTDRDIDYYQHKSKEHEEAFPPASGWTTCRNGVQPPPQLQSQGLLVPAGEEMNTLEHKLAQWAIENEIVEQVLGDTTIHREVVSRSTALMKFLASMCSRDPETTAVAGQQPNQFCLQTSHLLFAWKTCTRKADAAVSQQVYQLLVSVLPLCPSNRAIPLLMAIQTSLRECSNKRENLFEVSEFVSVLAAAYHVDSNHKNSASQTIAMTEDVRQEVLNLLWSVLTHPDVSALKSHDNLKRYVTHELKVEPKGQEHRHRFLQSCVAALSENSNSKRPVDEMQALRMVKLTRFILEACPRKQAEALVLENDGSLPTLLFGEVVAFLNRLRDEPSSPAGSSRDEPSLCLQERLKVLRFVYGLSSESGRMVLSVEMVKTLWGLCADSPSYREILMFFIANASRSAQSGHYDEFGHTPNVGNASSTPGDLLFPAFSVDACHSIFLDLFCSEAIDYTLLGERGYRSFHFLFGNLKDSSYSLEAKKTALDALWRIYLSCGDLRVASQAMRDLLSVYLAIQGSENKGESSTVNIQTTVKEQEMEDVESKDAPMMTDEMDDNFSERMFRYLEQVKIDLTAGIPTAGRSVERCIRLLHSAIGGVEGEGLGASSTLARLLEMARSDATLAEVQECLPHGMRGQACYRRIGIVVKRPQSQNVGAYDGNSSRLAGTVKMSMNVHPLQTLSSLKRKVASRCNAAPQSVRPIQINGGVKVLNEHGHMNFTLLPENTVVDELGVTEGCEFVFVITERFVHHQHSANQVDSSNRVVSANNLNGVFFGDDGKAANRLFSTVLGILEALPRLVSKDTQDKDIHSLIWDLLLTMPTNDGVAKQVKSMKLKSTNSTMADDDAMDIESTTEAWSNLLDSRSADRSVYVLLTIDAYLRPALEALTAFREEKRNMLEAEATKEAEEFRGGFIEAGGFGAVVSFFSSRSIGETDHSKVRHGNAVALRILKSCLSGHTRNDWADGGDSGWATTSSPDATGDLLLKSLTNTSGLLGSLVDMVVDDDGVSSATVSDILSFVHLLFQDPNNSQNFIKLPKAEKFFILLLLWDENPEGSKISFVTSASAQIRANTDVLILQTPALADQALPWLLRAIDGISFDSESSLEFFNVLEKLVTSNRATSRTSQPNENDLRDLATTVCKKLATCPRPGNETDLGDVSTGVLCGCLKILRALVNIGGSSVIKRGAKILHVELNLPRWSEHGKPTARKTLSIVSFNQRPEAEDDALVDLMGAIFDGFLSPGGLSVTSVCCDRESRRRGFDVIGATARACVGPSGYLAFIARINTLMSAAVSKLRHRWGQFGGQTDHHSRNRISKYSGLRNQGCTCYMNSVLQQLLMMPNLRESLCSAPLPSSLRSIGTGKLKGDDLVGKRISLQWENGASFEAVVEAFDAQTEMHLILYATQVPTATSLPPHIKADDVTGIPPAMHDEFILSEGRPGKETGLFEIVPDPSEMQAEGESKEGEEEIQESEDEAQSRHLLEEVQRTFIHLEGGSRGHCFDPRALVEACASLKLEFDVWQQNDASEFATKLLDRMEVSLKKWAPQHFRNMDHTFGLKQTKQKVCKQCGLKSNREEKLLSLDCQIRGKRDIHEALSAMTEVEIMEGSNKVFCEQCKENTDTILKTAISTFPNVLILSLKRFDLDYTTFETVKLNSRCAFGQTLDMKQYSLAAVEASEAAENNQKPSDPDSMDTDDTRADAVDPLSSLPDDFQYRLVGVLVHAGVAQGGHYYSFIKDRASGETEKWYRFDDEDVTPFDPSLIETECFGGKVKKETKWGNGQVQTVEQEQFANALMLFYEKVQPSAVPVEESKEKETIKHQVLSGYDAYRPDVLRSNETLQWQSFLFDSELHEFLKSMLNLCYSPRKETMLEQRHDPCRVPLLEMLLSFVFDVMVYSSDFANSCTDWALMLDDALGRDHEAALHLVKKLAFKTSLVSGNWLRMMFLDCPEQVIRGAGARIFFSAISSTMCRDDEMSRIIPWVQGWREEVTEHQQKQQQQGGFAIPANLTGPRKGLEDVTKIESGSVSSLGIIISHLNVLLDALPRCWRFSTELCVFLRNLSKVSTERGEAVLKRAMIDAQIPLRVIALLSRDRPPQHLRTLCPAASLSVDLANTQLRPESSLSTNVLPISNNQGIGGGEFNGHRAANLADYLILLECLACFCGLGHLCQKHIVRESDDNRGRQWFALTQDTAQALQSIFHDMTVQSSSGMGQRELESYLQRSGMEPGSMQPQKCIEILSKYGVTGADGKFRLTLEGFTMYHRDCVQTSDATIRNALHVYGFRPDLSRRSREARIRKVGERETPHPPLQSVAIDIAETLGNHRIDIGYASRCLRSASQVFLVAADISEPLMAYLVAGSIYLQDAEKLIDRTLGAIYTTPKEWEGDKKVHNYTKILSVIAATPGSDQQGRIDRIMNSDASPSTRSNINVPVGILQVLRKNSTNARQGHQFFSEFNWVPRRYIGILKELEQLYCICLWMNENKPQWHFIERDLNDSRGMSTQGRFDYLERVQNGAHPDANNPHCSDSEMNDSEEDEEGDEDSGHFGPYGNIGKVDGPSRLDVTGAGLEAVNGTYIPDGNFEGVVKYLKEGIWQGATQRFYIFLCNVSNNTQHWYISIVPASTNPGTSSDIDFYTAPRSRETMRVPPKSGWIKAAEGKDPVPTLQFQLPDENQDDLPSYVPSIEGGLGI